MALSLREKTREQPDSPQQCCSGSSWLVRWRLTSLGCWNPRLQTGHLWASFLAGSWVFSWCLQYRQWIFTHIDCMRWSHFTPDLVLKDVPQTEQTCGLVESVLRDESAESLVTDGRDSVISIESNAPWKLDSSLVTGLPNPTHGLGIDWLLRSSWWYLPVWQSCCEDGVSGERSCDNKSSADHTSDDDRATEVLWTGRAA
jgi:hypothetical protein